MICFRGKLWLAVWLAAVGCGCASQVVAEPPTPQVLPTQPGDYKLSYRTTVAGKRADLAYVLRLPADYDHTTDRKPVLIFMHGAGECGIDCAALYMHGPLMELEKPENKALAESFPFILIAPQCPPRGERWDQDATDQAAVNLLRELLPKLRADPDRIYLTGLSMGGKGAWLVGMAATDLFAAINPIASYGDYSVDQIQKLRYTNVWMIAGSEDGYAVEMDNKMLGFLKSNAIGVRNQIVPKEGHEVYDLFYGNPQFYESFLSMKRPAAAEKPQLDAMTPFLLRPSPPLPTKPGHYQVTLPAMINGQPVPIEGSLFIPKSYKEKETPLIVFLHEYGVIGKPFNGMCLHGIDVELAKKGNESFIENFPAVVFSPRCPPGAGAWSDPSTQKAIIGVIEDVTRQLKLDASRVYLTGYYDGGAGTWQLAATSPETFAAIAPFYPPGAFTPSAEIIAKVKGIAQFESPGNPIELGTIYKNALFYDWLMKQKK